jgi:SAM-dependent methyltransferase
MISKLYRRWRNSAAEAPSNSSDLPDDQAATGRYTMGLHDLIESGWFNADTGELYPCFPVTKDDIVLDVGCGTGGKMGFCARQGAHIVLVDIDESAVANAMRLIAGENPREITPIVSDCDPMPLPDGFASRIVASEVLEHVDDPVQFLGELVRVGRPGSLYLLTVPDPVAEGLQKQLAPPVYFEKPNHLRVFGREQFADIVTDAGLEILHRGAFGFYSALWLQFFWTSGVKGLSDSGNPLLDAWSETWRALLATPDGMRVKRALDEFMPMSQCIVARKS